MRIVLGIIIIHDEHQLGFIQIYKIIMEIVKAGRKISKIKPSVEHSIRNFMSSLGLWDEKLASEIPKTCENYGGLLLFNHPAFSDTKWLEAGEEFWRLVCSLFKGESVAMKGRIKDDPFRSPQAKLVFGRSPIASFTDNGIRYSWNIEKIMFSRGNVTERHRVAKLDCTDQVVVDLFAGIGYFAIPFLVHANAKLVHACEWNPDAIQSLRENLGTNKVSDRCIIHEGDNRLLCPKRVAHIVNLGLIPTAEDYWETACQALLPSGGQLFVHQNIESKIQRSVPSCRICAELNDSYPSPVHRNSTTPVMRVTRSNQFVMTPSNELEILWKWPEWFAFSVHLSHTTLGYLQAFHGGSWSVSVPNVHKVKSYAPHIDHVVLVVKCERN